MRPGALLAAVLVAVLAVAAGRDECPAGCEGCLCSQDGEDGELTVECDDYHGAELAPCVDARVVTLVVTSSALTALTASDFHNASSLRVIHITNSPALTSIEEGTFNGLTSLITLYLPGNGLDTLPDNLFANLSALRDLSLKSNALRSISVAAFAGLGNLTQLELEANNITEVAAGAFSGAPRLASLDLSLNALTSVTADMLLGLPDLRALKLHENQIDVIAEDALRNCTALGVLTLGNNRLSALPETLFEGLAELTEFFMTSNMLTEFPTAALSRASSLTHLQLNENPIQRIPAHAFESLSDLDNLHLEYMPDLVTVEDMAFAGLPALKVLDMDFCPNLNSITAAMLQPNEKEEMTILKINNNSLTRLSEDLFIGLSSLRLADISGNPLECSCEAAWLRQRMEENEPDWVEGWKEGDGAAVCGGPDNLRGRRVYEVDPYDLTCEPAVAEEQRVVVTGDMAVLEVMLKRGVPSTYWVAPGGSTIMPDRTGPSHSINVNEERYLATEEVLANNSVQATLIINSLTTQTAGTYNLVATNAGGTLTLTLDLPLPTTAPSSGLSAGQTAGVVFGALLLLAVLVGFLVLWLRARGQQPYNRFEGGTLEKADDSSITATESAVVEGSTEEAARIRSGPRSYGGTDDNPFSKPAEENPQVV